MIEKERIEYMCEAEWWFKKYITFADMESLAMMANLFKSACDGKRPKFTQQTDDTIIVSFKES